ncbi:unnamed protein product [Peronospora destructor]|uniref:Neprosin domain-containing protein n=1 Tax=Peronospora destructor TaxID=86335 RepID=A0AAV0TAG3_9STRA|nr:unnamed protein product [Peronospora destructor]
MSWPTILVVVLSLLGSVWSEKLPFDEVAPFAEEKNTTSIQNFLALKFKPQLHISFGCYPYPAVDAKGNTNAGLGVTKIFSSCGGSPLGSQVYGRIVEHNGFIGIMYAWYLPKAFTISPLWIDPNWMHAIVWINSLNEDSELLSVTLTSLVGYSTYSPPTDDQMDGSHVKLKYRWLHQTPHYLTLTDKAGTYQNLIMWDDMTQAAREAFEHTTFSGSEAPISPKKFERYIKQAYPF